MDLRVKILGKGQRQRRGRHSAPFPFGHLRPQEDEAQDVEKPNSGGREKPRGRAELSLTIPIVRALQPRENTAPSARFLVLPQSPLSQAVHPCPCGLVSPTDITLQVLTDLVQSARSRTMSILHPSFNIVRSLREALHRHLPDNVHQLISGKMCISLTRVSDWENVLVSEFQSKDDVVDALICTSFIPYFCGLIPPTFRGVRYVDGGFTNSVPCFDDKTTITESPFLGEHDSCPEVKSTNFLYMDVSKMSLHFCLENVQLIRQMVFPPDGKVSGAVCSTLCSWGPTSVVHYTDNPQQTPQGIGAPL
ncbi:PREDICTED: patatin-like phospholipase domain-containing protein 3 [Myotis davidii]|uniref:patatin-like phospholipase domain-containing protein 3 n=1 Tax=Myotis davidii TaxID=225400 RepID=UPI0003EC1724|nr:PREDICTED: patatin-like phospholipase domain-containing protein 3 [Myotis davidii]